MKVKKIKKIIINGEEVTIKYYGKYENQYFKGLHLVGQIKKAKKEDNIIKKKHYYHNMTLLYLIPVIMTGALASYLFLEILPSFSISFYLWFGKFLAATLVLSASGMLISSIAELHNEKKLQKSKSWQEVIITLNSLCKPAKTKEKQSIKTKEKQKFNPNCTYSYKPGQLIYAKESLYGPNPEPEKGYEKVKR